VKVEMGREARTRSTHTQGRGTAAQLHSAGPARTRGKPAGGHRHPPGPPHISPYLPISPHITTPRGQHARTPQAPWSSRRQFSHPVASLTGVRLGPTEGRSPTSLAEPSTRRKTAGRTRPTPRPDLQAGAGMGRRHGGGGGRRHGAAPQGLPLRGGAGRRVFTPDAGCVQGLRGEGVTGAARVTPETEAAALRSLCRLFRAARHGLICLLGRARGEGGGGAAGRVGAVRGQDRLYLWRGRAGRMGALEAEYALLY